MPIMQYERCNLARVPAHAVMTRNTYADMAAVKTALSLVSASSSSPPGPWPAACSVLPALLCHVLCPALPCALLCSAHRTCCPAREQRPAVPPFRHISCLNCNTVSKRAPVVCVCVCVCHAQCRHPRRRTSYRTCILCVTCAPQPMCTITM
jgi:hypothetical protein